MSQEKSSRRSQRTVPRQMRLALLGGSLLVFLAGSTCLGWAIGDARLAQVVPDVETSLPAEQAGQATPAGRADSPAGEVTEQEDPVPGPDDAIAKPAQDDTTAREAPPAGTEQTAATIEEPPAGDVGQPAPGTLADASALIGGDATGVKEAGGKKPEPPDPGGGKRAGRQKPSSDKEKQETAKAARGQARAEEKAQARAREKARAEARSRKRAREAPQDTAITSPGAAQSKPKGSARKKKPATRTVSRRVAVHRAVEHKAVEITERAGTETTVRRGACPVCGKTHARDFTERVFDHYETVRVPAG